MRAPDRAAPGPAAEPIDADLRRRHFRRKHGAVGVLRPGQMKALRLHGVGDLRLHKEPDVGAGEGRRSIDVTAVGLCGSDRHWVTEGQIGDAALERPLVLGHEFAGVIASGPRSGERVALDPAVPCDRCAVCAAGLPHLCPQTSFAGHGRTDGALRTRLAWPDRLAHPLPDALGDAEAALLEPLGVALHALDLAQVREGMTAGVFGCGPIGLLLIQALAARGAATVVATDPLPHRRAAAEASGADWVVDPRAIAEVPLPGGLGADVVFEAAGTDEALADASRRCARAAASSSSASRMPTGRASPPRPHAGRG